MGDWGEFIAIHPSEHAELAAWGPAAMEELSVLDFRVRTLCNTGKSYFTGATPESLRDQVARLRRDIPAINVDSHALDWMMCRIHLDELATAVGGAELGERHGPEVWSALHFSAGRANLRINDTELPVLLESHRFHGIENPCTWRVFLMDGPEDVVWAIYVPADTDSVRADTVRIIGKGGAKVVKVYRDGNGEFDIDRIAGHIATMVNDAIGRMQSYAAGLALAEAEGA